MIILVGRRVFIYFILLKKMFITVSNSHKADIMDYGKSAVIIECNSLFQSTQCQYATLSSGDFIFSSAFLIDLWFSGNKTGRDVLFVSCIIRWYADLPRWPGLSHFLFLKRKEIRPVLVALLRRVCEMLARVVFMLVYFFNDVRWHRCGPCFSFSFPWPFWWHSLVAAFLLTRSA